MTSRTVAALMVASLVLFPFAQLANAAVPAPSAPSEVASITTTSSSATTSVSIPGVVLDTQFTPLPRGGKSPWDGEFLLDGIDGLTYNSPGTEVKVRAMSSNAFFVDEVWLVYPRVQYLFNNKDVPDLGNQFDAIQFSDWIAVGTFPPGTELIFGVKTGVGIDDKCQDRVNADSSVDHHHCYKVVQDPNWVPLAPDPLRVCALTDDSCRNKAWPSTTPDGRTIFYTGPGVRNVKDDSPHGRFQYLTNTKKDGTGTPLTNTALFGLEDVGAPLQKDGTACPTAKELATLVTTTPVVNLLPELTGGARTAPGAITQTQTVGLSTVSGLGVNKRIQIHQPFQRETVTITAIDTLAKTITAVFTNPDNKPYPAGTSWAPEGCDWHPDFQDAGIVIWPALAATCQATTVKDRVAIVGQEGYGTVTLRDSTQVTPFTQTFAPGELIDFTANTSLPRSVTLLPAGSPAKWAVNVHGKALMTITDETKPVTDANRTLDAGICYDPQFPPPPIIPATLGAKVCATGPWDFTISNVTETTAPPSVRVTFTNDQVPPADEAMTIPLTSVVNGIAHYQSDQFTSLRVVGATTSQPTPTWTGEFKLVSGPCPDTKTADLTQACPLPAMTEWDLTITGTTQLQAPAKVQVTWKGQTTPTDVPLSGLVVGGVAHYRTTANLTLPIVSAAAQIQGTWSGTFTLNGDVCPTPSPSPSPSPTPSGTPPIPVRPPTITDHECVSSEWHFVITSVQRTTAPASITVTWASGATAVIPLEKVSGTTAHYRTTLNLDSPVTNATTFISGSYGNFNLSHGPCRRNDDDDEDDDTPRPSPSPSSSVPPSSPSPTISVRSATLTSHACVSYEWHFVITSVTTSVAPASITVRWANGAVANVPIEKVSGGTAHYRTTLNLGSTVTGATAVITGAYGQFNLSHGPCRIGDDDDDDDDDRPRSTTTSRLVAPTTAFAPSSPQPTARPVTSAPPSIAPAPPASAAPSVSPRIEIVRFEGGKRITVCFPAPIGCRTVTLGS